MSDRPKFLTEREWEVVKAVEKNKGARWLAAQDLGITESAVESALSRIRLKVEDAYKFNRKYKNLIARKR